MGWEAWLVLVGVVFMVYALAREWVGAEVLTVGCLLVFVIAQGLFDTPRLPTVKQAF